MKSETVMLGSLFAACLLVCALVLGSMFTMRPAAPHALAATTRACAITATGTSCPLSRG